MEPLGMRCMGEHDIAANDPLLLTEEEAYERYAPDTAFVIDLDLAATNTVVIKPASWGVGNSYVKIDWGDGTVIDSAYIHYYGTTYSHTYEKRGRYVMRVGAATKTWYEFNAAKGVLRILRWADYPGGTARLDGDNTWNMANLTTFPDGKLPRWPSGICGIDVSYSVLKDQVITEIPEWPSSVTSIGNVYMRCTGLAATVIPEWPKGATSIGTVTGGTYFGCRNIKATRIPDWPDGVTYIGAVYEGCTGIVATVPKWPSALTSCWINYDYGVYRECTGLYGDIPAWPSGLTKLTYTYAYCSGLTNAWTTVASELMPTNITEHSGCVSGTAASLRALFYSDWGGTRTKEETTTT